MFSDYIANPTQTTPNTQAQSQFDDIWKTEAEITACDLLLSSSIMQDNWLEYFSCDLDYENNLHSIPSCSASSSSSAISTNQLYRHNTPTTPSLVPSSPISPVAPAYSPPQPEDCFEESNTYCMSQTSPSSSFYGDVNDSPYSFKLTASPVLDQPKINLPHYASLSEQNDVAENVDDETELEDSKDQDFSQPASPTPVCNAHIQIPPRLTLLASSSASDGSQSQLQSKPHTASPTSPPSPPLTTPVKPAHMNQVSQEDFDANPAIVLSEYPDSEKPSTTYAQILTDAIKRAPKRKLLLDQIYDIFISKYKSYKSKRDSKGWQNSVRHNLSLYACFYQQDRLDGEKGRGKYWLVDESITSVTESNRSRKPKAKLDKLFARTGEKRSARSAKTKASKKAKHVEEYESEDDHQVEDLPKASRTKREIPSHSGIIVRKEIWSEDENEEY
ncbi:hypothetical protein E3P77_01626 [Wallemia ichthyophaga]|nr:hypothetical protein E3P77_01626 [Wallemia ichthyophaga]